ncbi:MAG TPA: CocE/NonD family hydrolase, partial [Solimonas sp.]|nr:CocE/NonD family hydrolase [Solimonas sp.]
MTPSKWRYRMLPLATLLLAACHSSSPVSGAADPDAAPGTRCDNPAPPGTMEASIEVDVPSDTDATANPTPTTRIPLTVHLPRRCPGERFPLILYGHGFSESRGSVNSGLIDDGNMQPLLERGYVAIKFDQRGHGDNRPPLGGGYSRLMDPAVETQDARAILDWAWEHAAEIHVQTEPGSGVAKDLRVGTLGASYGGGFQLQLVALDSRIDVIAPDRTWHSLLHSVLPGDVLKTMARLLTLFIQLDQLVPGQGVTTTPLMQSFANQVGPLAPTANLVRTREELAAALERPTTLPRPVSEEEAIEFVQTHAPDYFQARELAGQPWGFGAPQSRLRPVPALFTQGQRDVLFSATEAYRNASWFEAAGAEVRVITHEDGHQNPLAGQTRGVWACGTVNAQEAILAWLDRWLKGRDSAAFRAIPKVCISVLDSGDPQATPVGVALERFPVGSLDGQGAVPLRVPTVSATVGPADADGLFLPLATIAGEGRVLAGIPRVGQVTVTRGIGTLQAAIA